MCSRARQRASKWYKRYTAMIVRTGYANGKKVRNCSGMDESVIRMRENERALPGIYSNTSAIQEAKVKTTVQRDLDRKMRGAK